MDINQALKDFTATIQAKPQLSNEELKTKFPEFNSDESLIQAARDYAATSLSGKYKSDEELNSKFPEFFNPVPMARPQEQSFALPGVTLPKLEKEDVIIENEQPITVNNDEHIRKEDLPDIKIKGLNKDNSIYPNNDLNKDEINAVYGDVPSVTKFKVGDEKVNTIGIDMEGDEYKDNSIKTETLIPEKSVYGKTPQIKAMQVFPEKEIEKEIQAARDIYVKTQGVDPYTSEVDEIIQKQLRGESYDLIGAESDKIEPPTTGIFSTYVGSLIPSFFSGAYGAIGNTVGFARDVVPMIGQAVGFDVKTPNPSEFQRDMATLSKRLNEISLVNGDKSVTELYDEGNYIGIAAKVGRDIVHITPTIIASGSLGGVGYFAALAAEEKYDALKLDKTKDQNKAINALATGVISGVTMKLALQGLPMALPYMGQLVQKYGADATSNFLSKSIYQGTALALKHSKSYVLPAAMAVQGMTDQYASNVLDYATGVSDNDNFTEGVAEAGWSGLATGIGFGLKGAITHKGLVAKLKTKHESDKADLTKILKAKNFTEGEINDTFKLLEFARTKAEREAIITRLSNKIVNPDYTAKDFTKFEKELKVYNDVFAKYTSSFDLYKNNSYKFDRDTEIDRIIAQQYLADNAKGGSAESAFGRAEIGITPLMIHDRRVKESTDKAEAHITSNINPDTNTLMTLVINDVPRQVIKGKVAFREDGSFDKGNSDKEFYYLDENGETQVASSEAVSEVVENIPYEEAIERAKQDVAAPIQAKFDNEQALPYKQGEIVRLQNGQVGTILGQAEGEYIFQDQQGNKTPVKQEAIVNEENIRGLQGGEIVDAIDNNGIPIQGELNLPMDLRSQGLADVGGNIVPIESIKKIAEEVPEEQIVTTTPSEDNKVSEIGSTTETAPLQDQTAPVELLDNNGQLQTTAPTYPTNKKGEVDFDAMTDEQNFMYSKENYGDKEAMDDLNNVVIAVSKQVEATKKKIASATDLAKKNKLRIQLKAISERYTALLELKETNSAPVEFKDFKGKPKATVEAKAEELAAEEAMNGVPDITTDIAENARLRGFRSVNGERVDRNPIIKVEKFTETERKFSDKEVVPVKRTLVEVESLQPSHKNGLRNNSFFITEAQPKERVDKASQEAASKIAQNINPNEITGGVTAYTGAPIVNAHGEVLQGNNRTNGLIEMYETGAISIEKYKQHLINNAADYGMTPEEVAAMKNPVAVDIAEIDDAKSIRIGQLNAADTESGGVQRIPAQQAAVSLGEDIGSLSTILYEGGTDDLSMYEALDINGRKALEYLHKKGIINNTQLQSAYDSKGNLTAEAKIDLQDITSFALFNGANDNMQQMFRAIPAKAQKAILQTIHRDAANPRGESLIDEVRGAIEAYNVLRQDELFNSNTDYEKLKKLAIQLKGQTQLFNTETNLPLQKYSNFAIELAVLFKSDGQNALKSRFNDVYNALQGVGGDLFNATETLSLEQAIKKYFNNIDYVPNGQTKRTNVEQNSSESEARRTGDGGTPTSGKQSTQGVQPSERGRGITADKEAGVEESKGQVSIDNEVKKEVKPEVKSKWGQAIQGLETYSREEIKSIVLEHIEDILSQNDIDAPIIGLEIIGSRNRGDAKKQSDLDVVVEYSGNEREDGLFNILNEKPLEVEGIKIDINPINKNKTGTLEEYLEKSNKYDKSQLEAKQAANLDSLTGGEYSKAKEQKDIETAATKYGYSVENKNGVYTVKNSKGKEVAKITRKGNKYTISHLDGEKILSGNKSAAEGLEKVIKEYWYGKEIGTVNEPQAEYGKRDIDKEYFDAIARDDMETAQRIVDQQAAAKGYISSSDYRMMHQAPDRTDSKVSELMDNDVVPSDYWTHPQYYQYDRDEISSFYKIKAAIERAKEGKTSRVWMYRAIPKNIKGDKFRNGDWITPSREYAQSEGLGITEGYRIIAQRVDLNDLWWDANSINEFGFDDGKEYAYQNTKNNRKLTDVITKDADGNIIPPSKRFNKRKFDVAYEPQVQYGQENSNQEALDAIEKEYNDTPYKETKMEYGISEKGNMFGTALEKNVHHELIAKYLATAFNGLGYTHKVDREPTISHAKSGTIYVSGGGRDIRISDHMGRGGVWTPTNDISTLSEAKDIISKTSTYDEVEAINRRNREESNRLFNERKAFQEELKSKGLMYKVTARTYQPLDKFTSNKPTITDIKVTELGMKNGEMAYKYEYIAPLDFLGTQAPNGYIDWYKEKNANILHEQGLKYGVSETGFYSTVEKALTAISQEKGTKAQFKAMLLKNGAKQAELDWMRFDELPEKLTKADIQNWIDENRIEVEEVEKIDRENATDKDASKYSKYHRFVLPGGENYKEVLLTMPPLQGLPSNWNIDKISDGRYQIKRTNLGDKIEIEAATEQKAIQKYWRDYGEGSSIDNEETFKSSHFDERNILAHVRFNERTINGERVLLIEEFQSDWAQTGKKEGFKEEITTEEKQRINYLSKAFSTFSELSEIDGIRIKDMTPQQERDYHTEYENLKQKETGFSKVPDMPFKKTDQWVNLAARRMMRYAAENGFDRIAWTNGKQQADRYKLSTQIDNIEIDRADHNGGWLVTGYKNDKDVFNEFAHNPQELESYIGKELAQKIVNDEIPAGTQKIYSGIDLELGGEGMKAFYDAIVPSAMSKLGKPFGAKVENVDLSKDKDRLTNIAVENEADIDRLSNENYTLYVVGKGKLNAEKAKELFNEGWNVEVLSPSKSVQQSIPVTESMKKTASEGMPLFEPKQTFINFTPEEVNQETELAHGSTELQKAATAKTIEAANSLIIKDDNLRGLHPLRNGRDTQPKTGDLPYNITPAVSKRTVIKGYKEKGFVNFNGTKIEGHQDFADLWSIHRSPLIEKFHVGFLNADGIVLGSMAITSGKSDVVMAIPTDEVIAHANKLGATQVYLLHNHPSGNPEPSTQDVNLTFTYVDDLHRAGIKVVGQVVVNHSKYSFIDAQERPGASVQSYIDNKVEQFEYKTGEKPVLFTERESLGEGVNSKRRMFEIAYGLLSAPSYKGSIVWLTSGLEIAAYDIFPEGATKKDMIRIANAGVKKNLGVRVAFIHNGDKAFAGAWNGVPEGTIDIIDTKLKKSNTNYTRVRSNKPEANTLWVHQIIGEYGAKNLDKAEEKQKQKQFDIVSRGNPMLDDYHTGIRSIEDIKTFEEAYKKDVDTDYFMTSPDYTQKDVEKAIENGEVTIYSSYPIKNGVFVTPSKMEAQAHSGNGKVYSKKINLSEVAWINNYEGQYANISEVEESATRLDNLNVAKEMEATKTPKEIRLATGWERGVDGKYRYETGTNDLNPQFKSYIETGVNGYAKWNSAVSNLNRTPRLIDIYGKDNELFKAYPQLKSIEVELLSDEELGANGAADTEGNKIYINSKIANKNSAIVPSILEHEVQHFIQEYEGFAKGGDPSMFTQARDNIQRLLKDISNVFDELGYEDWLIDGGEIDITPSRNFNGMYSFAETQEKSRRDKMVSKLDEANKVIEENNAIFGKHNIYENISDPELYKLLAGEVEARNSQTRMDYTPEQRRERLLSETADVAPEEQTVLMENLGVSHSEDLQDEFDNAISIRSEVVGMEEKVADLNKKLDKIGNRLVESYADDALPVKQWQELLTNNGVEIPDEMNYYMRVTMVPGRIKARKEYFDNTHRDPFVKILKDYKGAGWGYDEIATYTKLKHAPEYSAHIKKQKFESMGLSEETVDLFVSQMSMPANEVEAYWENWADEEIAKLDKSDKDYERKEQNIIKRAAKRYEDITADYAGQKAIEERIGMTAEEYISKFEDIDTDYWEKIAEKEISKIKHKKGSSMYTYEKQRIMAKANDPVAYLWDKIRGINDFALDEEVRSGARTKESAAEIKAIFENYVPLKGHRDATAETTYDYNRDSGDRFVKLVQKGKGRKSESFDPFAYMMQGAESSVRQAEKTLLNQTIKYIADRDNTGSTSVNKAWFVKVGEKDGKPEFELAPEIQFDDTDTQKTFNEKLDVFEKEMLEKQENGEAFRSGSKKLDLGMFIKPASAREHEVLVHRSGVSYVVRFNTNPRIAQSINDTNKRIYEGFYGDVLKVASAITRFKSASVTMFRPTFIFVTNPLRDFDMVLNMSYVDEGAKFTGMFLKNFPVAIKTMVKYAAKQSDPSTNKYDAMLIDYIMQGGVTGISKLMELQQQTKSLKSDVNRAAHPAKALKNLYESLSEVTENQTRLAVYFAAIEKGYSPTKATFMAKEASLNFDRTGSGRNGAKEMQTFKMFSKVGFQALYNVYNRGMKNPKTKLRMAEVLLAKTLLFGSLSTFGISILLNNLFGDGDDEKVIDDIAKLNPHKVNSSFSLRMPDGSFIHLPLSQELRAFNGLGTNMTLFMLDRLTATEAAIEFASSMSDLIPYNPVSEMLQYRSDNYGAALTASTFDALAPLAELEMNRNYYGGRIYKENQKPETPGYKQIRKTKSGDPYLEQYAINFAKWVDTITGGDGAVSGVNGKITNPEKWKHLMGGYTGGWFDQANYLMNLATKEEGLGPDDLIPSAIYTSEDRIQERSSRLNSDYFDAIDDFNTQKSKITNWKNAIKDNEIPVETREGYVKKLESNITERYIATDALAKIIKKYEEYLPQSEDKKEDIRTINKFKQLVVDLSDEKNSIEEVNKKTQAIFDEILQKTLKNN